MPVAWGKLNNRQELKRPFQGFLDIQSYECMMGNLMRNLVFPVSEVVQWVPGLIFPHLSRENYPVSVALQLVSSLIFPHLSGEDCPV